MSAMPGTTPATTAAAVAVTDAVAHLPRLRWAVRATLTLGVAASVAANVLHARPNPISQLIAAWPPLALLLTVELISRVPHHRRSLGAIRIIATTVIAAIATWVSYWHLVGVAARYGETEAGAAYLLPISVDGLVIVASVSLVEITGRIRATTSRPATPATPPEPLPFTPHSVAPTPAQPRPTVTMSPTAGSRPDAGTPPVAAPPATTAAEPAAATAAVRLHRAPVDPAADAAERPPAGSTAAPASSTHPAAPTPMTHAGEGSTVDGQAMDGTTASDPDGEPRPLIASRAPCDDKAEEVTPQRRSDGTTDGGPPTLTGQGEGDGAQPSDVTAEAPGDGVVPSETAAAVAYWYRRDPDLHPAKIAARIGRSERTVRRYWPPPADSAAPQVNSHHADSLSR